MKVLVVSASRRVCHVVSVILAMRWPACRVTSAAKLTECTEKVASEHPDIVLVDHDEPSLVSFDVVQAIRAVSDVPVIVLARDDDPVYRVQALEEGADDWIVRSQGVQDFLSRVNAVLRRSGSTRYGAVLSFDGMMSIDCGAHKVTVAGREAYLTPIETKMLYVLARRAGTVVCHEDLGRLVWGPHHEADREVLKKYVRRLRVKLEEDRGNPKIIRTEKGAGYVFVPPRAVSA